MRCMKMKIVCPFNSSNPNVTTVLPNLTSTDAQQTGNELGAFLYCLVVIAIYVAALAFLFVR